MSKVAVLKTSPQTVIDDYEKLMYLARFKHYLPEDKGIILKLNLSWTKFFPSCSSTPWQLDGVLTALKNNGYSNLYPVENKTVVTNPIKGAKFNKWNPVLKKHDLKFIPLTNVEWVNFTLRKELLALDDIFPKDFQIPKMFIGKSVIHLPTMKCVHPDTELFQEDGSLIKIKDLVDNIYAEGEVINEGNDQVSILRHGIFALTETGLRQSDASHFWKTENVNNLMYLRLKTGRTVKTSLTHPFLTQRGWVIASQLTKKDRIAIPRIIDLGGEQQKIPNFLKDFEIPELKRIDFVNGKKHSAKLQRYIVTQYLSGRKTTDLSKELNLNCESIRSILKRYKIPIRWIRKIPKLLETTNPELWEWLGLLFSEGYIFNCNGSLRTSFSNTDAVLVSRFVLLTKILFGLDVKIRKWHEKATECYFDCNLIKPFYDFFEITLPTSSATKLVPSILFKCTKEEIGAFLSGYIDGDGMVGKDGLHITSKSPELIQKMQLLMIRLGTVSFIHQAFHKATNSKMKPELYYSISVYGDELVNLSRYLKLNTLHKQENLQKLKEKRFNSKSPSNWDTIPIDRAIFRIIREGLGISQNSSGKPSGVNSIENGYSLPTRNVMNYFIDLFKKFDKNRTFSNEIQYLEFMSSKDIAWDHINIIKEIEPDIDYLYDLSVPQYHNFVGNGIILHNTHGHTTTTGAMKNAFGGLITARRHHCHKKIHEVLVDLLTIQKEIHPSTFAVMDGTVAGDGNGPRTMMPKIANFILASNDQVAIDAIAARMMGFDPMKIRYIKLAHDMGLGCGDVSQIDIVGDDITNVNLKFSTGKSPIIFLDQMLRNYNHAIERYVFHTKLFNLCIFGSEFYHDHVWYNTVGKPRINKFMKTGWGKLFKTY